MNPSSWFDAGGDHSLQVLWEDGERVFCRGWRLDPDGQRKAVLPAAEHPTPASLDRLAHEYGLKDDQDGAWAVRPLELGREGGRTALLLGARRRAARGEALSPSGRLIADLILELALIIGDQPAVPDVPLRDAHRHPHLSQEHEMKSIFPWDED
jgi:hypothetical protein